jgi:hypothetical protein
MDAVNPEMAMVRHALRVLLVMVCAVGGSWGFAAGPHATSHAAVGATQPGHHHVPGGHGPQVTDEGTRTSARRRIATLGVRLRRSVRAAWTRFVSAARRLAPTVPSTDQWGPRHWGGTSLITLCVCRT